MSTPRSRAVAALAALAVVLVAARARAAETVPGKVIVRFAAGQRASALDRAGVAVDSVDSVPHLPGVAVVDLAAGEHVADAIKALEGTPGVVYAQPQVLVHTLATPNDPEFLDGNEWALLDTGQAINGTGLGPSTGTPGADIHATAAWDLSTGSRSVLVGVVDNGVDAGHPDLAANVDASRGGNTFGGSGSGPDSTSSDGFHGTHVTGIIGAVGNNGAGISGVNWAVTVLPVKALGCCGPSGASSATVDQIAAGLALAGDRGAPVVNGSIGTPAGTPDQPVLTQAVTQHPGTLYVFAAGNDGTDNDAQPVQPCNIPQPNVICVARTQPDDTIASNSNYGATTVDIGAPGGRILSTVPFGTSGASCSGSPPLCLAYENGTSMATPMVTGVAALILARNPWSSVAQVKDAILSSADPTPQSHPRGDTVTRGRLDAFAALLASDDAVKPDAFSLLGPRDGSAVADTSPTVSWSPSADAKSGIDHYDVLVDGAVAATTSSTAAQVPLPEGAHSIAVRAVDRAGNQTATPGASIVVDRTPPTTPGGGAPLDGDLLKSAKPSISWTRATDPGGLAGYDVSLDGGAPTRVDAAQTSFAPGQDLAQGLHRWSVRAVDRAGNSSGALVGSFVVDSIAPRTPRNARPKAGGAVRDRTPRLHWSAVSDDGSGLDHYEVVLDGTARHIGDTELTPTRALARGRHRWSVAAVDLAGNVSPVAGGAFTVDTTRPRASATAALTGGSIVRVRCRTNEDGRCAARVVVGGVTLGRASAAIHRPGDTVTVRLSARARSALHRAGGPVLVRVTITDAAGNAVRKTLRV